MRLACASRCLAPSSLRQVSEVTLSNWGFGKLGAGRAHVAVTRFRTGSDALPGCCRCTPAMPMPVGVVLSCLFSAYPGNRLARDEAGKDRHVSGRAEFNAKWFCQLLLHSAPCQVNPGSLLGTDESWSLKAKLQVGNGTTRRQLQVDFMIDTSCVGFDVSMRSCMPDQPKTVAA